MKPIKMADMKWSILWLALVVSLVSCGRSASEAPAESLPTADPASLEAFTPPDPSIAQSALDGSALIDEDSGANGLGDNLFPLAGNGGYDAQHYTLDLTYDIAIERLHGTATMEATATQDLSTFNLDFVNMRVENVQVDGAAAEYFHDETELIIRPEGGLSAGQTFSVIVTYGGFPQPQQVAGIPITTGWIHYKSDGVYVASEPVSASSWYPVNNHPQDKATYTFRITVDKPLQVAANGLLQETIDNGDTTTFVWDTQSPTASFLTTIVIGDLVLYEQEGPAGLPLRSYFPAEIASEAEGTLEDLPEMVEVLSEFFGPYPFEAYGIVAIDEFAGFALETQTLSLFTGLSYRNESTRAHELAHQWFGDSVSVAQWEDIWLAEGFATYASGLWFERTRGDDTFQTWVCNTYAEGRLHSADDLSAGEMFGPGSYRRGASTLHALRLEIGDEAFFETLHTYTDRFRDSVATTEDFIAVAEEVSGQELDAFFFAWLVEDEAPDMPGC